MTPREAEALRTMSTALTAVVNLLQPALDCVDTRRHIVLRAADIAERAMHACADVVDDASRPEMGEDSPAAA